MITYSSAIAQNNKSENATSTQSESAKSQITKVSLQASGLTCSMCSNSINKSLKTLSFIATVNPDVQTSTFEITFKQGSDANFDAIKKKVEDAGFSVAGFMVTINFKNANVKSNQVVTTDGNTFHFLNVKEQTLNGLKQIRIVDKGFLSNKEYKKNAAFISSTEKNVYYATI